MKLTITSTLNFKTKQDWLHYKTLMRSQDAAIDFKELETKGFLTVESKNNISKYRLEKTR